MSRRVVGPFNRVEGDLEVRLEIAEGAVRDAWVVSPLYRGFEQILHGKDPRDALVYTPRICGICSVSQSMAAAFALAEAQDLAPPANGTLARNLVLGAENTADHLTHFYLFFMPDFCRRTYEAEPWFAETVARFKAMEGTATREMLPARAAFMHLMGILAGKWPHSLAIQPGGSTRSVEPQERVRILTILAAFRRFLETALFGDSLERVVALESEAQLEAWAGEQPPESSDFRRFLTIAESLSLDRMGRAGDRFMSYGAYDGEGGPLFAAGLFAEGRLQALDPEAIVEDVSHAWMAQREGPRHPYRGLTVPDADAPEGYSWCKAPRLGGQVVEVGALARQVVDGHPLVRDLVATSGGNVRNRVIARLLEIARIVMAMEDWARALQPREAFCAHAELPSEGEGAGLIEAARGSLGHWLKIRNGVILNYQIISPTTWNFSPRDSAEVRGALETALQGAPLREGEQDPVAVQHIVRSFDPCMVCTAH